MKREFAKLDALSDVSADAIYLEDQIVSSFGRGTGHPGWHGRHVKALGFGNPRGDESLGVRSDPTAAKTLPPTVEGPKAGFQGIVTSGKLSKVKEKQTIASIWAVTLAEKMTVAKPPKQAGPGCTDLRC